MERAENFDALMVDVSVSIDEDDEDPLMALDDHHIKDLDERRVIGNAIAAMQRLHDRGRDHIWAYYIRNMVRPVALSRSKVDVVIGNPPWINYNQTADVLRTELVNLSRSPYGIWAGGRYATHQDVAGLFFARSVHLYLKDGGVIGFVLPHSALQAGQYAKWRSGRWRAGKSVPGVQVDFTFKPAWDLEPLEPNSFFPVPASVAFARKLPQEASGKPLAGSVERWEGTPGADDMRRELVGIADAGATGGSPYGGYSRQGATIVPRRLFFVNETENRAIVQAAPTVTVNPRKGSQDKAPWKDLDLTAITGQTVEDRHLFDVHLGETVAPYVTLAPLKALLPLKRGDASIPTDDDGPGGIRLGGLERRMRGRWRTVSRLWEDNKALANRLNLLGRLDYVRNLSSQLEWQQDSGTRPIRLVYASAGRPTAALIHDDSVLVDYKLFWVRCKNTEEASYLLAIINSDILRDSVSPLMSKGQFGARDVQKHLWKLPIPEYDPEQGQHVEIAEAGATAAAGARAQLAQLRGERGDKLTVTIARRELRSWLATSPEGKRCGGSRKEAVGDTKCNSMNLERKFFEQVLKAELDVPVHATLHYEDETFEVILVPELTEEGDFMLKYYNAPAYVPEAEFDESGAGTRRWSNDEAFGLHPTLKRAWLSSDPVSVQMHPSLLPSEADSSPTLGAAVMYAGLQHRGELGLHENRVTLQGVPLKRAELSIVDLPEFKSPGRRRKSVAGIGTQEQPSAHYAVLDSGGGWSIKLTRDEQQTRDTIAHTGMIEKGDGGEYGTHELAELLERLKYFFAFVAGMYCHPTVVIGYDSRSRPVWGEVGRFASDRHGLPNWFNNSSSVPMGTALEDLFPKFWDKWSGHKDALRAVIECYVHSNEMNRSGVQKDAVVKSYAGLEILASLALDKTIYRGSSEEIHKVLSGYQVPHLRLERAETPTMARLCDSLGESGLKGISLARRCAQLRYSSSRS